MSEFRSRLVKGGAESLLFDRVLVLCREQGFLAQHGRQRTDSTHVLGAVRTLTRLACAIETLRTALDALAAAAPDWLRAQADKAWAERYERRGGDVHIPKGEAARRVFAETVGRDGEALLSAVTGPEAPAWLREVSAVEVLRRVWVQNYCRVDDDLSPSDLNKPHVLRWRTEVEGYPLAGDSSARVSKSLALQWPALSPPYTRKAALVGCVPAHRIDALPARKAEKSEPAMASQARIEPEHSQVGLPAGEDRWRR